MFFSSSNDNKLIYPLYALQFKLNICKAVSIQRGFRKGEEEKEKQCQEKQKVKMQCATLMWGMQIEVSLLFENAILSTYSFAFSVSLSLSVAGRCWKMHENPETKGLTWHFEVFPSFPLAPEMTSTATDSRLATNVPHCVRQFLFPLFPSCFATIGVSFRCCSLIAAAAKVELYATMCHRFCISYETLEPQILLVPKKKKATKTKQPIII